MRCTSKAVVVAAVIAVVIAASASGVEGARRRFGASVAAKQAGGKAGASCAVPNASRVDCRQFTQQTCESNNCCWSPAGANSAQPWCYFPAGFSPCTKILVSNSTNPPFSMSEFTTMQGFFFANLNIGGNGGVVASPDTDVNQGGSYYYHWERDGALSMRTVLATSTNAQIQSFFPNYVQWVLGRQSLVDPHGIDVRTEPKYMLPNGEVYQGGWCRPQTDGPGLRATTMMQYATSGLPSSSYISQYLWTGNSNNYNGGAIRFDLDWVAANWSQVGCDLWEEIQSNDFFWNRMTFRRAMDDGAKFAAKMGDQARAKTYGAAAQAIEATLMNHWNGQYLFESSNRPLDSSVLAGLNDGQDQNTDMLFAPNSQYVAGTIKALTDVFCSMFPLQNADTAAGIPGAFMGRYEGDHYGGGNPWILLTANLAEILYRGAQISVTKPATAEAEKTFRDIFHDDQNRPLPELLFAAGDGVMQRIRYHVVGAGFHLAEQIDKNTGIPCSATDLTWSYGATLRAVKYRQDALEALKSRL